MATLRIYTYPDEVLRHKADPVDEVDQDIARLMDDMVETMYVNNGIGLAAPQVGVSKRVIVVHVNIDEEEQHPLIVLANPEIVESDGVVEFEEGCLSLPGFTTMIKRAMNITVRGLGRDGNEVLMEASDLVAIALQHEIDHLEGTLIIDKASTIKRQFYKKKVKKALAKA
jgi:peptide deformylase